MTGAASTGTSASCAGSKVTMSTWTSKPKDDNDADAKDSKAAKDKGQNSKDAADDEDYADDDNVDKELERRREYWRKRLDRDW